VTATFIWLMFALKIPIIGLLCIVWWAIRQTPEGEQSGGDGGSNVRPPHPRPRRPPRPRRGPHGDAPLPAPARVRSVTARGRRLGEHV
jgi:hypothetical protein